MLFDQLKRREFIMLLGGAAAWPLAARAQATKVARIGYLHLAPASARSSQVEALRAGLRNLGYVEGKSIVIEFRWAESEIRNDAADPKRSFGTIHRTCLSALVTDRAMEAWHHPSIA